MAAEGSIRVEVCYAKAEASPDAYRTHRCLKIHGWIFRLE
jgi:hypothetical protein